MKQMNPERKAAENIVTRLRQAGHEAYLAGGCVRDILMAREPADFDVATSARPEDVIGLFDRTVPVGKAFGVILVATGNINTEVATFRADGEYTDGRRPSSITFCDAEGDARRRDFTVNAMFLDPETGDVLDFSGGRNDLETRTIRTVGEPDKRFSEDYLRMMRAVRFAATLDFIIEPDTMRSIAEHAGSMDRISGERTGQELAKVLACSRRADGLRLMDRTGLLSVVLPEIAAMKGVKQSPKLHPEGDVYEHTLLSLEKLGKSDLVTALSVLLHDAGKPDAANRGKAFCGHEVIGANIAAAVCRRLKFSGETAETVRWTVAKHLVFKDIREMRDSTLRRLLGHEYFPVLLELHRADTAASTQNMSSYDYASERLHEYREEPVLPPPLINGSDLLDMGIEEGPLIGKILARIYDMQLEGAVATREDGLALAEDMVRNL